MELLSRGFLDINFGSIGGLLLIKDSRLGCDYAIWNLRIDPQYRRKGYATQLIKSALYAIADIQSKPYTVGLTVARRNKGAIDLYTKSGFVMTKNRYSNGEYIMIKEVPVGSCKEYPDTRKLVEVIYPQ